MMRRIHDYCNECYFFFQSDKQKEERVGNCHRYPPQVIRSDQPDQDEERRFFPEVDEYDWCGEWRRLPDPPREKSL